MKNVARILIIALMALSLLPLAVQASDSSDTAWMDKIQNFDEYEKMADGDVVRLWIMLKRTDYVIDEPGGSNFYESNMRFFEKYVPEERKATATVYSLTPGVDVDATAAEIEYYARLEEVERVIIEEPAIIVSPGYREYLPGVWKFDNSVTASYIKGNVKKSFAKEVTVTDYNGNALSDDAFVGTGCRVTDSGTYSAYVVVKGDISGDGMASTIDYLLLSAHVTGAESLDSIFETAADFNVDGSISAADCLVMKNMLRR